MSFEDFAKVAAEPMDNVPNVIGAVAPSVKQADDNDQPAKKAKPNKTAVKAKPVTNQPPVTISITFSAADHERVIEELDGRPARSKLAEIIIKSMFGDKK